MKNNSIRETTTAKEKFKYNFLMKVLEDAEPELKDLEQKYNLVEDVARGCLVRVATMPDAYRDDRELTEDEENQAIKEMIEELNYKFDKLSR